MKIALLPAVCLILILSAIGHAGDKKPSKPATSEQDSYMQGRIFSAIEDEGAGRCCLDEAIGKLQDVNDDIKKLEYPAHTRWMAHYWYAKVLLEKCNAKKAGRIILLAQDDARSLSSEEKDETQTLVQEIQARNP